MKFIITYHAGTYIECDIEGTMYSATVDEAILRRVARLSPGRGLNLLKRCVELKRLDKSIDINLKVCIDGIYCLLIEAWGGFLGVRLPSKTVRSLDAPRLLRKTP